jgi:hypothetical protein
VPEAQARLEAELGPQRTVVDYHSGDAYLGRVFHKLDVRSRVELATLVSHRAG